MGIYLSTPKTEKFSDDGENDRLRYGLSSMQGWRATMEDAVSNLMKALLFLNYYINPVLLQINYFFPCFYIWFMWYKWNWVNYKVIGHENILHCIIHC